MAKEDGPNERSIYLSEFTGQWAPEVDVAAGIVTVLRFEQPCDPARTRMLGWEGRFEPIACAGKRVLVEPIRDLERDDRLMLLVTLADGTEVPFTVTSRQRHVDDRTGDQQVNVFRDHESPKAVLASLDESLRREERLREQVERYQKEDSVDHALAGLLVKGALRQTPFRERYTALFKSPKGVQVLVAVYASKHKDKAAVVFKVQNNCPSEAWSLMEARLITEDGRATRPFALRASKTYLAPGGERGEIAVVLDMSAFDSEQGPDRLVLELFREGDGLRQAWVFLDRASLR